MLSVLLFTNYNKLISKYKKSIIYYTRNDRIVDISNELYENVQKVDGKMGYFSGLDYMLPKKKNYWLKNLN